MPSSRYILVLEEHPQELAVVHVPVDREAFQLELESEQGVVGEGVFEGVLEDVDERKKQLVAQSPKFQKRPQKILEKPGVDEGQRPVGLDMATLQMKRLAEKARKQALAGELEGSAKAPSSTGGFQKAVQQRRKELQARQAAEEKERKEREEREKRLSKKKPASQLLGVIKSDNGNLSLLKVTMRQVDALKKAGEDPKMYLTAEQKRLMEEKEIKDDLANKRGKTQPAGGAADSKPRTG